MSTLRRHFVPILLLSGCGGGGTAVAPTVAPAQQAPAARALPAPPSAPHLRLGRDVVPTHYALDLTVAPTADGFDGTVDIDVALAGTTTGIWLNAAEIQVKDASIAFGGKTSPLKVLTNPEGDESHLGLGADRLVGPGPARLHIVYRGKLQTNETQGVFKQQSGDDWYVTTQFEEIDARRGFPCFDDPSFKTPWAMTLRVPKGLVATANGRVIDKTTEGDLDVVKFSETKPLPSYLVAFAVGPFEIVDGGKTQSGVPVRIFAFKGRSGEAAYAAESTRQILETLEGYYGIPYPFEKLDEVPIPKTVSFGAMENPGMVTYVEGLLLARKEDDTLAHQKRYASVCAHELAHQWFGDLVTLAWWNDTWLNESFANWMEVKVIEKWQPTWGAEVDRVSQKSRSLDGDTLTTARAVRQPIESEHDIANAFDNITYGKGSALLAMFESWIGEDTFRTGVAAYLKAHSYGNATAADFFAAISAAAGKDVAPVMSSFLDQAGEPLVTAQLTCQKGQKPVLALEQKRNLLPGEKSDGRMWQIPVCVRYGAGATDGRACTLLGERTGSLELDGACPAWVLPDAGSYGYYRSALAGDGLRNLIANQTRLTLAEQVGLAGNLGALVRNATVPAGDALAALPALAPAREHHLAAEAVSLLRQIRGRLLPTKDRPAFARYVQKLFGARAHALGFVPKTGETADDMELRQQIVTLVAIDGEDKKLQAEAMALALRYLDDRTAIHSDVVGDVLTVAARTSRDQKALFDRIRATLDKTTEPHDRQRLIGSLGAFGDVSVLTRALDLTLDPKFDIREASRAFYAPLFRGEYKDEIYQWMKTNFDRLSDRYPRIGRSGLMRFGAVLCDEDKLKDFQSFFRERAPKLLGGPRVYENTLEGIQSCIAVKKAQTPSVVRFFERNASST